MPPFCCNNPSLFSLQSALDKSQYAQRNGFHRISRALEMTQQKDKSIIDIESCMNLTQQKHKFIIDIVSCMNLTSRPNFFSFVTLVSFQMNLLDSQE